MAEAAAPACPAILLTGSKSECKGDRPSVCIRPEGNVAVTVYSKNNSLYYKVGKIDKSNMTIQWGDSKSYGKGCHPSIALIHYDGKYVAIEVHNGPYSSRTCYYHVGTINDSTIEWENRCSLHQKGFMPNVCAKDDRTVIVIYEKAYAINKIQYQTGEVKENAKEISWVRIDEGYKNFDQISGSQPSIAISEDNIVIVVYREDSSDLKYIIGLMELGRNINWGNGVKYAKGIHPSISVNAQGVVVEAHQSGNLRKLFNRAGVVNKQNRNITWNQASGRRYTLGRNPAIDISNEYLLEAHQTNSYSWDDSIYYSLGKLHQPDNPVVNLPKDNDAPPDGGPADPNDMRLESLQGGDNGDTLRVEQ